LIVNIDRIRNREAARVLLIQARNFVDMAIAKVLDTEPRNHKEIKSFDAEINMILDRILHQVIEKQIQEEGSNKV
jgi:hypothetical protein